MSSSHNWFSSVWSSALSAGVLFGVAAALAADGPRAQAAEAVVFITSFAAGKDGAIQAYSVDLSTGAMKPLKRTGDVENPFFLALSPNRKFLYSIHAKVFSGKENEHVAAYQIVGRDGELKLLNRQSAQGTAACYLDVDATGKTVLVANYTSGSVAALPVRDDGSLGEATTFIQHAGSSVDKARQQGPHAHCIVVSPDNRHAYAADLGLDQVLVYKLDGGLAKLTPGRQAFARTVPGAGPRHLTFHPNKRWMYVINELANSVTHFDYDAETGVLLERATIPTLPADFDGKSYCADLKITPNGKYLYGTNRGHDSLACYKIGDDGKLTLIGIEPSLGKGPQNLAILPGGELLMCANMPGNNVVVFKIDDATGKLKALGQPTPHNGPSCIMILP